MLLRVGAPIFWVGGVLYSALPLGQLYYLVTSYKTTFLNLGSGVSIYEIVAKYFEDKF